MAISHSPGIGVRDVTEAWVKKLDVTDMVITVNNVMLTKFVVREAVAWSLGHMFFQVHHHLERP